MLGAWPASSITTSSPRWPTPASRYVVVGGVAVNLQGVPRFTSDLDIAVALEGGSLATAARVLHGLGLHNRLPVRDEELSEPGRRPRAGSPTATCAAFTFVDPADPLREVDVVLDSPVPFEEMERTADRMAAGALSWRWRASTSSSG